MKHTVETISKILTERGVDHYLAVDEVKEISVILRDKDYGNYVADLKSFCPKSLIPLHKKRRHANRLLAFSAAMLGKKINGIKIVGIFYGPDKGYKNKAFYLECLGICGHNFISTNAHVRKHRKIFKCTECAQQDRNITHGARKKVEGIRLKRSYTYTYWQRNHKKFPLEYQSFELFFAAVGSCPFRRGDIVFLTESLSWVNRDIDDDLEIDLMSKALRSAFRHSKAYKLALQLASVETATGTKYRCAKCLLLFSLLSVQVDHIIPVQPLDGTPLSSDVLIDRIWKAEVQVLDRGCHSKKTAEETRIRKEKKVNEQSKGT